METIKRTWEWTKKKVNGARRWLWGLLIPAALASTLLIPKSIPENLVLKAPKDDILRHANISATVVKYAYRNGVRRGREPGEFLSRRTQNTQFFDRGKNAKGEEEEVAKVFFGQAFDIAPDGNWYEVDYATTTKDAYNQQTVALSSRLLERIAKAVLGTAYADQLSQFADSGDGFSGNLNDGVQCSTGWATARDAATGDQSGSVNLLVQSYSDGTDGCQILRAYLPVYTGSIPAGSTISSSTAVFTMTSTREDVDNDGQDYVALVSATGVAATSTIGTADYDGFTVQEGSDQLDIGNIPINNSFGLLLNAAGRPWIEISGVGDGWVQFGMREGHDIQNAPVIDGTAVSNRIMPAHSETAGTASDPYLLVQYAASASRRNWIVD